MELSVIVNIILCVLSFLLAVLSIVFVYLSLRQNNKLLFSNSRPYLTTYFAYEENNRELYLCIKNCGNSSAILHELTISPDIKIMGASIDQIVKGAMLAPGQQLHFLISQKREIFESKQYEYNISTQYVDVNEPNTLLTEEYILNISYMLKVLNSEHKISNLSSSENSLKNIEKDLKAIALQNL